MWSAIKYGLIFLANVTGLANFATRMVERWQNEKTGAAKQRLEDTTAENEELRKDGQVYMRPMDVDAADTLARRLARRLRRR